MKPYTSNIPPQDNAGNGAVQPATDDVNDRPGAALTDRLPRYVFFDDLVARLNARGSTRTGEYTGQCPAHDDRHASFSFTVRDGKFLFHCHAGCDYGRIVDALTAIGLWPVCVDQPERPSRHAATELPLALLQFDAELPSRRKITSALAVQGLGFCPVETQAQRDRPARKGPPMEGHRAARQVPASPPALRRVALPWTSMSASR